jgi:hypothetical protein
VSEARNAPKRSLLAQERSRDTRQAIIKAALRYRSADEIVDEVTVRLCRRMEKVPGPALQRIMRAQSMAIAPNRTDDAEHYGFQRGFAVIFLQAQQSGDIPDTVPAERLGLIFEAILFATLQEWAYSEQDNLLRTLRERFALLLAGARTVSSEAIAVSTGA